MIKAAQRYRECGISTIATDANKRSVTQWKVYQDHIGTDEEIAAMFSHSKAQGLAIVCGAVSGNLEAIDVDCKYDTTGTLFEDFMQLIVDDLPDIAGRLVIATTRGGGYHILYRCDTIEGNAKLARRPTTEAERESNPHDKVRVLIETRGEGGYIIAAPTEGYAFTQGTPAEIPTITPEQRAAIFEIARSFNTLVEQVTHTHQYVEQKSYNKSPFQDYNERGDIIGLLQSHGWKLVQDDGNKARFQRPGNTTARTSGDYCRELGLFAVFTTSTEFEPNKGYRPSAVYCMLECGGDWKAAARKLVEAGYGEPFKRVARDIKRFIRRQREDGSEGEALRAAVAEKFDLEADAAQAAVDAVIREEDAELDVFWKPGERGSKLSVVYSRFGRFLERNGFGLYFYDKSNPIYKVVHNDNNRLEEASTERIKKFTKDFLMSYNLDGVEYTREDLMEMIYKDKTMFTEGLFEFLHPVELDFLRDTATAAYFPFGNGVVEVTRDGMALRKHGEVNKVIWKADIIPHSIDIDYATVELEDDPGCEFADFLRKAMGQEDNRVLSACSIIGYLLHKYKKPDEGFAVILGEETDDEAKGGGTGKGIFMKAIEHMLSMVTIDGKTFNPEKGFVWQRVMLNTRVVVIQDAPKGFSITPLNSVITEGMPIEKKNKDELYLAYPDSPKIVVTTNYGVNDDSNHSKRRRKLIEFSGYFSPEHTPKQEYGHFLFDDWDNDEWNRFYNFMFWCVQVYLQHGIIDIPQGERYKIKKIKSQYGEEFAEFFLEYASNGCAIEKPLQELYNGFLNQYNFDKKDYSPRRFNFAVKCGADNLGYEVHIRKNRQGGGERLIKMTKPVSEPLVQVIQTA